MLAAVKVIIATAIADSDKASISRLEDTLTINGIPIHTTAADLFNVINYLDQHSQLEFKRLKFLEVLNIHIPNQSHTYINASEWHLSYKFVNCTIRDLNYQGAIFHSGFGITFNGCALNHLSFNDCVFQQILKIDHCQIKYLEINDSYIGIFQISETDLNRHTEIRNNYYYSLSDFNLPYFHSIEDQLIKIGNNEDSADIHNAILAIKWRSPFIPQVTSLYFPKYKIYENKFIERSAWRIKVFSSRLANTVIPIFHGLLHIVSIPEGHPLYRINQYFNVKPFPKLYKIRDYHYQVIDAFNSITYSILNRRGTRPYRPILWLVVIGFFGLLSRAELDDCLMGPQPLQRSEHHFDRSFEDILWPMLKLIPNDKSQLSAYEESEALIKTCKTLLPNQSIWSSILTSHYFLITQYGLIVLLWFLLILGVRKQFKI